MSGGGTGRTMAKELLPILPRFPSGSARGCGAQTFDVGAVPTLAPRDPAPLLWPPGCAGPLDPPGLREASRGLGSAWTPSSGSFHWGLLRSRSAGAVLACRGQSHSFLCSPLPQSCWGPRTLQSYHLGLSPWSHCLTSGFPWSRSGTNDHHRSHLTGCLWGHMTSSLAAFGPESTSGGAGGSEGAQDSAVPLGLHPCLLLPLRPRRPRPCSPSGAHPAV